MYVLPFHQKAREYTPLARFLRNAMALDLPGGQSRGRQVGYRPLDRHFPFIEPWSVILPRKPSGSKRKRPLSP